MSDESALSVPGIGRLGRLRYTLKEYLTYAQRLQDRAEELRRLGGRWGPYCGLERALWFSTPPYIILSLSSPALFILSHFLSCIYCYYYLSLLVSCIVLTIIFSLLVLALPFPLLHYSYNYSLSPRLLHYSYNITLSLLLSCIVLTLPPCGRRLVQKA